MVGGPGRETDQAKEGEEVVSRDAVICTLEVMEEEMVWLVGLEPRVESVINLLNVLLNALAKDKSALCLLKQLSQTGCDRGSKDICPCWRLRWGAVCPPWDRAAGLDQVECPWERRRGGNG